MSKHKIALAFVMWIPALATVRADDGAASIAEGGIVMMASEPRITMAKEVLQISTSKVTVDYDFRNDTDQDIVTVVAFPIPAYTLDYLQVDPGSQGFDDFRLWIDGRPAAFYTESRAYVDGVDKTALLNSMRVDVASFGHAEDETRIPGELYRVPDVLRLKTSQRQTLQQAELLDAENDPRWEIHKKYYWEQKFPAQSTVHVRHVYTPAVGTLNSIRNAQWEGSEDRESKYNMSTFCIDGRLRQVLSGVVANKHQNVSYEYVDFILTTANTWKTPIEDFTLIVDRSAEKNTLANYVSFCWDSPVTESDSGNFIAKATNFVPKSELRIGFFHAEKMNWEWPGF
jgi:hypothetical protein